MGVHMYTRVLYLARPCNGLKHQSHLMCCLAYFKYISNSISSEHIEKENGNTISILAYSSWPIHHLWNFFGIIGHMVV
jgi:hypothetical protein